MKINIILHNLQKKQHKKMSRVASLLNVWLFVVVQYPDMSKTMGEFTLDIKGGEFTDSEIMVMLGENGEGFSLNLCGQGLKMVLNWTFQMFRLEAALEAVTHFIISKPILKNLI